MKTDILKFKVVVAAAVLLSFNQVAIAIGPADQKVDVQDFSKNEFFEIMTHRIKYDAVGRVIDLVENLISKNNKENFTTHINHFKNQLTMIYSTILLQIKQKLETEKVLNPHSTFCIILEKTYKVAYEMAYVELQKLITILEEHKKSPDAKKATALASKLKPHLTKLTSVDTLNSLEQKLNEIIALCEADNLTSIVHEINQVKKLLGEIKTKAAAIQNDVNVGIITVLSNMLKRP